MNKKTTSSYWDNYWNDDKKTRKIFHKTSTFLFDSICKVFDKYLPVNDEWNVLEIGGGGGSYLMYIHEKFLYQAHTLDYSVSGNEKTRQYFEKTGTPITLYTKDLFSDLTELPLFDVVYSLGFIEHFDNPVEVVNRHLALLKPNGLLILGVPNLTGIYYLFLKHLAPSILKTHNLKIMNINNWKDFEQTLKLNPIFKSYFGGFEPMNMKKIEKKDFISQIFYFTVKVLMVIFSFNLKFLRKINSMYFSAYMIGVFRKAEQ